MLHCRMYRYYALQGIIICKKKQLNSKEIYLALPLFHKRMVAFVQAWKEQIIYRETCVSYIHDNTLLSISAFERKDTKYGNKGREPKFC